ncbi:MAG TPA: hypothetical protein VED46_16900, partial [Alphaproteobacteria bacterium]|nr:hypothetical protein [Alphaproteobacteria bacterium]
MNIKILISDPTHSEVQLPDGLWIASGLHRRAVDLLRRNPTAEQAETICRDIGDAVIIRLVEEDNCVVGVDAWRGITAGFEVYYSRRPDGSILLSDHFRNILVEVPMAERTISDQAIIDHFLFRAVPAPLTYTHTIRRLGHGDRLSID